MQEQKQSNTDLVERGDAAAVQEQTGVAIFDPSNLSNIPDLDNDMEVSPVSEVSNYWTPEEVGESKRVFFEGVSEEEEVDFETGESKNTKVVYFWEKVDGTLRKVCNKSAKLVGHFFSTHYQQGQPLLITYKGKVDNKTNQYKSDNWEINKLYPKK